MAEPNEQEKADLLEFQKKYNQTAVSIDSTLPLPKELAEKFNGNIELTDDLKKSIGLIKGKTYAVLDKNDMKNNNLHKVIIGRIFKEVNVDTSMFTGGTVNYIFTLENDKNSERTYDRSKYFFYEKKWSLWGGKKSRKSKKSRKAKKSRKTRRSRK